MRIHNHILESSWNSLVLNFVPHDAIKLILHVLFSPNGYKKCCCFVGLANCHHVSEHFKVQVHAYTQADERWHVAWSAARCSSVCTQVLNPLQTASLQTTSGSELNGSEFDPLWMCIGSTLHWMWTGFQYEKALWVYTYVRIICF